MKSIALAALFAVVGVFAFAAEDTPKPVGALAPLSIDRVFEKARTPKDLDEAFLNDPTFKNAVKDAFAAKASREKFIKQNPGILGPTPAQAAPAPSRAYCFA